MKRNQKIEAHKQAEIDARTNHPLYEESRKPFGFDAHHWIKWTTINHIFQQSGIKPGSKVLDIGCGAGWTSIFLGESGYEVLGVDIVPQNVDVGNKRAKQQKLNVKLQVSDMDDLNLKEKFDVILIFDSLHHSIRQENVIGNLANHLKDGGWIIFGEPSILHTISPEARRTTREQGIIERGITLHSIKKDCRKAGLGNFQRFFEGTRPYKSRTSGFSWQLIRLVSANFFFAPQASLWIAAQKKKERS